MNCGSSPRSADLNPRLSIRGLLVLWLLGAPSLAAQEAAGEAQRVWPRCEFGLVLSGGGARGIAHIGVLEVFEEHGIVPDCIAGASMGSIVGSLYATGHTIQEIRDTLTGMTWRNLYAEPHNRNLQPLIHRLERQRSMVRLGLQDGVRFPAGLLDDTNMNRLLIEHLAPAGFAAGRDFSKLPIPFRTLGTDLLSGGRVVLDEGDLARAVRASMSVPLAYPPVEWDDALLVDGGMVDNVPVALLDEIGAEFVVAVDVSSPLEPDVIPDVFGVTRRIVDLLFTANNNRYTMAPDLRIRPDLGDHNFADYSGADELIAAGRAAALAALEQIPTRFAGRDVQARIVGRVRDMPPLTVGSVGLVGNAYLSASTLRREVKVREGSTLDFRELVAELEHLASTGLVTSSWIDVIPDGDAGAEVQILVREEYRNTIDVGLGYQSDDQAQVLLRFETRDVFGGGERLQLGGYASARDLRGDVRLLGEDLFGAHLGYQFEFVAHDDKPKYYVDDVYVNRALFRRLYGGAGANVPFGLDNLLSIGIQVGQVETVPELGVDLPAGVEQQRLVVGRYVWDDLDSLVLPTFGRALAIEAEYNATALGATSGYWRLDASYRGARAFGRFNVDLRARYGFSDGDLPVSEQFHLGGPELVPGLAREQLWGDQTLAASLALGYDPFSIARVFVRAGAGNVWVDPADISWEGLPYGIGVGSIVATPLGPVHVEYGWQAHGQSRFYVALGWQ